MFESGRLEPVTRQVAPTWMGAITAMTETGFAGEMRTVTDVRIAVIAPEDFTTAGADPARRFTAA